MGRPDPSLKDGLLAHLRRNQPSICRHWFDDIDPVDLSGLTLQLLVREQVQLRYLQRCCVEPFQEAAQAVTGNLLSVRFIGDDEYAGLRERSAAPPKGAGANGGGALRPAAVAPSATAGRSIGDMVLHPDYVFSNFIVGPDNQLARAAALAIVDKPGRAYNPFFIHSGVGLGKTHLLQAVCHELLARDPACRIHYVSCDTFKTEFYDAVQAGQMAEFRHRFRHVDLLLIDDIHDLSKHEQAQEEFFHTFNALYQAGRQIVLSSDAAPSEIPMLEERLTSRFQSGLVARIDRPCYETRLKIVASKAAMRGIRLPEDVMTYVAARIDSNIRELEGAITKIQSNAALLDRPITLDLAQRAIGEVTAAGTQPTIQQIMDAIARFYDVKLSDLLSRRRHKSIALPRQVGMWLARKYTRFSLEEIGGYFGGRDHTTVMHAVREVERRRRNDLSLDQAVSALEQQIAASGIEPVALTPA